MLQRSALADVYKNRLLLDPETVDGQIAQVQHPTGEIPWHLNGQSDPWDHVEAAMGLTVGGYHREARKAYRWLAQRQRGDGSWYAYYQNGHPLDRTRDSNFCAYIAVGVYHYFLSTGDTQFVGKMWPTVRSAINFTLNLQAPGGEIYWAISPEDQIDKMALLTGSSAIYLSLKSALSLAAALNPKRLTKEQPTLLRWRLSSQRLGHAIRQFPHHFNMTKSRFSMDWFYPVLSGAITGCDARERINRLWKKFVVENEGVRCVSDRPWITVAETAELILALEAMGRREQALIVFGWIAKRRFSDGTYWCGYTIPEQEIWPTDCMTWTNAVVLLAADSLFDLTPAAGLFRHSYWHATPRRPE